MTCLRPFLVAASLGFMLCWTPPAAAESPANEPLDRLVKEPAVAPPPPVLSPTPTIGPTEKDGLRPPMGPPLNVSDLIWPMLKTFLMLGVVLAIAYLTLHKGLGKLVERQTAGKRVKVVERIGLDQRRSLYLIDIDGQQMLLGASDHGVVHLRDVASKSPTPPTAPESRPNLMTRFTDVLDRRATERPTSSVPRSETDGVKS
jgi:flagellar biogenesis protein FliO